MEGWWMEGGRVLMQDILATKFYGVFMSHDIAPCWPPPQCDTQSSY